LGYISVGENLGMSSTTFTQCAPKATEFGDVTQNKGHYAIQGHRFWYRRKVICDFLLVINTNLLPTLHRFRDIAFDRSKRRYTWLYPSCVYSY